MKYYANLTNTGGRNGLTKSDDGQFSFTIQVPENLKQADGTYNPELLVAAGVVSCYNGAFLYHLEQAGKDTTGVEMKVEIELVEDERDGENMLDMKLIPSAPHLTKEEIKEFAAKADKTCPYTKLFRGEARYRIVVE